MPYEGTEEVPYEAGSDTSRMAARMLNAQHRRGQVYRLLAKATASAPRYGLTDDETERVLNARHQSVSAARRWLVLRGLVKDSGRRRLTSSGRPAAVWVTTRANERTTV